MLGPVIMTNCDQALIILDPRREEPVAYPLPAASRRDLQTLNEKLVRALERYRGGRPWSRENNSDFEEFLKQLWLRIVQPIFRELENVCPRKFRG
jgi:hypothetical protein